MNLLKVKTFRCYQAVKVKHEQVTHYLAGDQHHRVSNSHEVFFAPSLTALILKCKESGSEIFVPLTNIQNFDLFEEVIKKAVAPYKEEDSADHSVETPSIEDHSEEEGIKENPEEKLEEALKKKVAKKAAKKVTKKT